MIYFDAHEETGLKDALNTMCECGHNAGEHGCTMNGMDDWQYLYVLQCVLCDCKQFKVVENDEEI